VLAHGKEEEGISALRSIGLHEPGWIEDQGSKTTGMDNLRMNIKDHYNSMHLEKAL
jgi:hypothetical protein